MEFASLKPPSIVYMHNEPCCLCNNKQVQARCCCRVVVCLRHVCKTCRQHAANASNCKLVSLQTPAAPDACCWHDLQLGTSCLLCAPPEQSALAAGTCDQTYIMSHFMRHIHTRCGNLCSSIFEQVNCCCKHAAGDNVMAAI